MINGDTETSTTNINYDGSAVSALVDAKGRGPVTPTFNRFLKKLPLVTTTAQSADSGALSHEDYRLTALQLLPDAPADELPALLRSSSIRARTPVR